MSLTLNFVYCFTGFIGIIGRLIFHVNLTLPSGANYTRYATDTQQYFTCSTSGYTVDGDAASVASSFETCQEDSGSMDIEPDPDGI